MQTLFVKRFEQLQTPLNNYFSVKSSARKCKLNYFPDNGWNREVLGTGEMLHTKTPANSESNESSEPETWKLKPKWPYKLSCCCEEDINSSVQSGHHGSDNPAFVRAGQLTNCEWDVSVYCAVQTQKDDKGTVNY